MRDHGKVILEMKKNSSAEYTEAEEHFP